MIALPGATAPSYLMRVSSISASSWLLEGLGHFRAETLDEQRAIALEVGPDHVARPRHVDVDAVELGEHGTEVLAAWLKMDKDQIDALRKDSVVT
jgi:hypothetical protein